MDNYKEFREILDTHPSGAPESKYIDEILKILFTAEEMAVAVNMSFKNMNVKKISELSSLSVEETLERLESMAEKAIIFSKDKNGEKTYGLLPTIPGLFEFPFMKGGGTPMHDKLGKLWEKYHADGLGDAFSGNPTPLMRVIPVDESFPFKSNVHPYEQVHTLIESAKYIALTDCACRVSVGNCEKPKDVCLIFDSPAKFLVERGYAKQISVEEGLEVLQRADEAGLVHTSNNSIDRANLICNCCSCCCTVLRGKTQLKNPNAFFTSSYLVKINDDLCTGCGICVDDRCPMGALKIEDNIAKLSADLCIGCGLCVTGCPSEAVELIKRDVEPEVPATVQEMGIKKAQERGSLEKFIKIMQR